VRDWFYDIFKVAVPGSLCCGFFVEEGFVLLVVSYE
jgi:hypothetical protein